MIVKAKKLGKLTPDQARTRLAIKSICTSTSCWLVMTNRSTAEVQTFYYPCELPF